MEFPATLSALAAEVGCSKYPPRWDALYGNYVAELKENGNPYIDPDFYAKLNNTYGILNKHLSLYQKAAVTVGENDSLSLFLYILCKSLEDRDHHSSDMAAFSPPKKEDDFASNMICALAAASEAPMCHQLLLQRNLPQEIIDSIMNAPEFGITYYKLRHDGIPGYNLLDWYQLAIDGHLFRIGRLEFEIFATFYGRACVYENEKGKQIALAHDLPLHASGNALGSARYEDTNGSWTAMITETETHWIGYPVNGDGTVSRESVQLPKFHWKKRLSFGDPVVSIHIPAGGGLTEEVVSNSIAEARDFLRTYFPDYTYQAFVCYSWLMDSQLTALLGDDSNIAKFNQRFAKLTRKSSGLGVFNFVYLKADTNFNWHTLPENTTLEKKLKEHYLSGRFIYEITGYFF